MLLDDRLKLTLKTVFLLPIKDNYQYHNNYAVAVMLIISYILCTTIGSDGGPTPRMLAADIVMLMSVEGEPQVDSS